MNKDYYYTAVTAQSTMYSTQNWLQVKSFIRPKPTQVD